MTGDGDGRHTFAGARCAGARGEHRDRTRHGARALRGDRRSPRQPGRGGLARHRPRRGLGGRGPRGARRRRPGTAPAARGLRLDADSRSVVHAPESEQLTPLEYGLLEALLADPGRVLSFADLTSTVWGTTYTGDCSHLHAVVRRLRVKLEAVSAPVHLAAVPRRRLPARAPGAAARRCPQEPVTGRGIGVRQGRRSSAVRPDPGPRQLPTLCTCCARPVVVLRTPASLGSTGQGDVGHPTYTSTERTVHAFESATTLVRRSCRRALVASGLAATVPAMAAPGGSSRAWTTRSTPRSTSSGERGGPMSGCASPRVPT